MGTVWNLLLQWLQHALWDRHRVRSPRLTLAEIAERASLDPSGNLTVDGQLVSVAYFRAGYAPTDYPSEKEWQARWEQFRPGSFDDPQGRSSVYTSSGTSEHVAVVHGMEVELASALYLDAGSVMVDPNPCSCHTPCEAVVQEHMTAEPPP